MKPRQPAEKQGAKSGGKRKMRNFNLPNTPYQACFSRFARIFEQKKVRKHYGKETLYIRIRY